MPAILPVLQGALWVAATVLPQVVTVAPPHAQPYVQFGMSVVGALGALFHVIPPKQ